MLLPRVNSVLKQRIAFDYLGDPVLLCSLLLTTVLLGLLAGAYPAFVLSAYRPAAVLKGTLAKEYPAEWSVVLWSPSNSPS